MRFLSIFLLVIVVAWPSLAEELPRGLTKEQPKTGPYVKTDDGHFMVPYTMKIPATEVEFTMIPIPGGKFSMGSPADEAGHESAEGPQVEVSIQPFWMGRTEVTWAQYWTYMDMYPAFKQFEIDRVRAVDDNNAVDAVTTPTPLYEPDTTYEYGDDPDMPAVSMTQFAAKQYTKWLTAITGDQYRLPCEAEWEYACRAGTTTAFHFGNDPAKLGEYAWFLDNSDDQLPKVATKKPNPWGLYDMHGSAWEWVIDAYTEEGHKRLADKADLTAVSSINWPVEEFPRTVKGGSWDSEALQCRAASKMGSSLDWKENDPNEPKSPWWHTDDPARGVGFRLLRPLKPLPREKMKRYWEVDDELIEFAVTNRLEEGRGVRGLADDSLPAALIKLKDEQ